MRVILLAVTISAGAASSSCGTGSGCGLALQQRVYFPTADLKQNPTEAIGEVPCCGASVYRDIDLTADNVQVDLINSSAANAHVDTFLTSPDCVKLFNGSYAGTTTAALCTIYIGPVVAGSPSGRKAIRRGKYRMFAQAYSVNDSPAQFLMEIGLWAEACHWNPIAP